MQCPGPGPGCLCGSLAGQHQQPAAARGGVHGGEVSSQPIMWGPAQPAPDWFPLSSSGPCLLAAAIHLGFMGPQTETKHERIYLFTCMRLIWFFGGPISVRLVLYGSLPKKKISSKEKCPTGRKPPHPDFNLDY